MGYLMQNGMDLSLKIQHVSNGGIRQPNPGVLIGIVKLGYEFQVGASAAARLSPARKIPAARSPSPAAILPE